MLDVSVAATVLNEAEDIGGLVSSLMGQTPAAAEVIIVDGGSTDGTWEWLIAAKAKYPTLMPIRDESCSLKHSPGPIARGRNVGIRAATSDVVACADAGCTYEPDWLARLTGPILDGTAEYSVGGSCVNVADATVWDIASAPFFGVKLSADEPTKSCTARSMAFRKALWQRVGGFPETVFLGEDTLFDQKVRATVVPAFAERAKAIYGPRHTLRSAVRQLANYAVADGAMGVRPARLMRNLMRCVVEVLVLLALPFSVIPFVCIFALEAYFAFRLDWRSVRKASFGVLAARLMFSFMVPWVVTWNQIVGGITKANQPNRQNIG
ncbi:MAG: glycosyltransferase [Acidobacteriota bacterium]|nr:glycosyltransferase [Acidobacteriota bacterium]